MFAVGFGAPGLCWPVSGSDKSTGEVLRVITMVTTGQNRTSDVRKRKRGRSPKKKPKASFFSGPFRTVAHYQVGSFDGLDNQGHKGVRFDASYVSSIYGGSVTVQPPAMASLVLIKT